MLQEKARVPIVVEQLAESRREAAADKRQAASEAARRAAREQAAVEAKRRDLILQLRSVYARRV